MPIAEILETLMIISFGISWPLNILKSYRSRTTKGKSLPLRCSSSSAISAALFPKFC